MNGAKNAPAIAPHDTPISCAINVTELLYCTSASTAEIAMNTTTKIRINKTCADSFICGAKLSRIKSSVNVDAETITKLESVDIDADKTKITTSAIMPSDRPLNIVGIIESKPFAAMSTWSENNLPKPPRK